ncbi:MAG: Fe-S cluster assembly scaffold protein NifU [Candidatus Omnitrophica bacterium]|nr:Fe-S cluster assembly scaffold protein NifU [Candidatus Omnitrophota bacterium]
MTESYTDKVFEYFRNPRNMGELENPDGVGKVGNAKCGDVMWVYIKVKDSVITDCTFKTFGCVAAIATSSALTELVKGKTLDDALKVTNKDVANELGGLPPIKMHCSLLAEQGLKSAIEDYRKRLATNKD